MTMRWWKKIGISIKTDYLRYVICCWGITLKIRHRKSSLVNNGDASNAIYLHLLNGKVIKNPYIPGLKVCCLEKTSHNQLILHERLPVFTQSMIKFIGSNAKISIAGSRHYVTGLTSTYGSDVKVKIGKDFSLSGGSISCEYGGGCIEIGKECMGGFGIMIRATDGHAVYDMDAGKRINDNQDIKIGNHVWLSARCNILKGSEIADNSIVAAAALVNGKFADNNVIIAGIPAKVVRRNINWHRNYNMPFSTFLESLAKKPADKE